MAISPHCSLFYKAERGGNGRFERRVVTQNSVVFNAECITLFI